MHTESFAGDWTDILEREKAAREKAARKAAFYLVAVSQGRGRDDRFGLNIRQREEMAAALRRWWRTPRTATLILCIPGGGCVTLSTEQQAIKLYWRLTGDALPFSCDGVRVKPNAQFRKLFHLN